MDNSKKTFSNFDKELLKKKFFYELQEQWSKFIIEWKMLKWTGEVNGEKCPVSSGTWYKWRIGLFELMDYTDNIKICLLNENQIWKLNSLLWKIEW